jgi:DNA-binding LacI/PurR family transcriptional regulator
VRFFVGERALKEINPNGAARASARTPSRINDVARVAGVSTATVSHVINNTKFVTEKTRASVLSAIEQCNYYPNAHARSLASGRSQIIGLLVSDISNPFFPELVKSIETAAFERGFSVILLNTNYDATRAADYVRRLIELNVSGVALMTSELDPLLVGELTRKGISVVSHNLGQAGEQMSNIIIDYDTGIDEAMRHLASLGHRRIVHIAGPKKFFTATIRRDAYLKAMAQYVPDGAPKVYDSDFRFDGGRNAAQQMLSTELPTAVLAANDMMALGAMQEFRSAGLNVPRDVSVVGFDDIAFASLTDPPLTTVCSPRAEIGRRAFEALMISIEHADFQGTEVRIPTYLIKRGSTAPPRPDGAGK